MGATSRRLVFAAVATMLALLLVELVGRLVLPDPREAGFGRRSLDEGFLDDPLAPVTVTLAPGTRGFARRGYRFRPQTWALPKPSDTYRIAFVGDSTVHGRLPDALQAGLVVPGRTVEVLNFGLSGAASDRVHLLARGAIHERPDLMLVYVGHNESVSAALNPASRRSLATRAVISTVTNSGVGRLLHRPFLAARASLENRVALGSKDDGFFSVSIAATEASLRHDQARVVSRYEANVAALCREVRAAGIPLALVEPVSSLTHAGSLPDDAPESLVQGVQESVCLIRAGDLPRGQRRAAEVSERWPLVGPPWSLQGSVLLAEGRSTEALDAFRRARRLDAHGGRASEPYADALRRVAAACGATFVPTEAPFLADARYLADGDPLFVDRVHPTLPGNALLAHAIASAIRTALPAGAGFDAGRAMVLGPSTERERAFRIEPDIRERVLCDGGRVTGMRPPFTPPRPHGGPPPMGPPAR
jgi:lysophospholipase L1-like esterase